MGKRQIKSKPKSSKMRRDERRKLNFGDMPATRDVIQDLAASPVVREIVAGIDHYFREKFGIPHPEPTRDDRIVVVKGEKE